MEEFLPSSPLHLRRPGEFPLKGEHGAPLRRTPDLAREVGRILVRLDLAANPGFLELWDEIRVAAAPRPVALTAGSIPWRSVTELGY